MCALKIAVLLFVLAYSWCPSAKTVSQNFKFRTGSWLNIWKRSKIAFYSKFCLLLNATKFWDGIKKSETSFCRQIQEQENKKESKRIGWEICAQWAEGGEVFSGKLTKWKQLAKHSSISERRPASTAIAFPLLNHCLCHALGRVHAQSTEDVGLRGQTGMPHISSFLFCPFFFCCCCCWLLSDKTLGRIAELISRIEGVPQSWSSTPLHYVCLRGKLPKICWSQTLIRRQASRHCQSAVDLNPGPHAVSVFFLCVAKLRLKCYSESTKLFKSFTTQRGSCWRWLRLKRSSTSQEMLCIFFFLRQPLPTVWATETWTW